MWSSKIALEGQIIDERFQITGTLAEGGFGAVYIARQLGFDRDVAVKFLHHHLIDESDSVARFEREAKALSSLTHKNLVSCYAYGTWRNRLPYAVFELVKGKTLKQQLSVEHRIPWQEAFSIGIDVCSALSMAHGAGIVHRDLKPENIMVATDGTVKVLDFGLAHIDGQQLTQTGALVGSLMYMSPEQASGKIAIPESDIYSLGCVLYEAICGQPPLLSDNPMGILHKHRTEYPQQISKFVKNLPDSVENVLSGAMTKDSKDRYSDAATFAQELQKALSGGSPARHSFITASAVPQNAPAVRQMVITGVKITAVLTMLLILIGMIAVLLSGDNLARLIIYRATFEKPTTRANHLEKCGDWLTVHNLREPAQVIYTAAADDGADAIARLRRLDKLAKVLELGGQRQECDKVVLESIRALNALPTGLSISDEEGNVLVSAIAADTASVIHSQTEKRRPDLQSALTHIESLLQQNSRLVQWISVTDVRQNIMHLDILEQAIYTIQRANFLQTRHREDLIALLIDRQISTINRDSTLLRGRLKQPYLDLLVRLKSDKLAQGKTINPIITRVVPCLSTLRKGDRQRLLTNFCYISDSTEGWIDELATLSSIVGTDYQSDNKDDYHQAALLIHACSLYAAGQSELAFKSCCQLAKVAQGLMLERCIYLSLAVIRSTDGASPRTSDKLTLLTELIPVRTGSTDGAAYAQLQNTLVASLQAQKKYQAAIMVLRRAIATRSTLDAYSFNFYTTLEDTLEQAKMPAENSIQKCILPKLRKMSRLQRNTVITDACQNGVAGERWNDIASLEPLIAGDWQAGDDHSYQQAAMFIRACSSYVSGKSNQAFDQCCQLVKTPSNSLLDNCIRLALLSLPDPKSSTFSQTNAKLAHFTDLIELQKERIAPYRLLQIYQAQLSPFQTGGQFPQAVVALQKLITTLMKSSTPDTRVFIYYSYLVDDLKEAGMPPDDTFNKKLISWLASLSKTEQTTLVSTVCSNYAASNRWGYIAALKPIIGDYWQQSADPEKRKLSTLIQACSMYESGKPDQAFDLCYQLVKTSSGPLTESCSSLALLAASDSRLTTTITRTNKLADLAASLAANKENISSNRLIEIYDRQFRSLQEQNRFQSADVFLRKIIAILMKTTSSDVSLFFYCSNIEVGLRQAKLPRENSVRKIVNPRYSQLPRSERNALLTTICGSYLPADCWSDVAALGLLPGEKSLPGDDAAYRQSTAFIQACSFYDSRQFEKAFDQCCQLIKTASNPLLSNCIALSVAAIDQGNHSSNSQNTKLDRLVNLIETSQPELEPSAGFDQALNTLIERKNFVLALRLLRRVTAGWAPKSPPFPFPYRLFSYYSLLEYSLNQNKLPAEDSIQKYAMPYLSSRGRSDRIRVLNRICGTVLQSARWQDIAALEPLIGDGWKEGDGDDYRQSIIFIQACSYYASGNPKQALENCCRLLKTASGGLIINCLHLSAAAIGSARYPDKSASEQFARIERLMELSATRNPIVGLWSARLKTSFANQRRQH